MRQNLQSALVYAQQPSLQPVAPNPQSRRNSTTGQQNLAPQQPAPILQHNAPPPANYPVYPLGAGPPHDAESSVQISNNYPPATLAPQQQIISMPNQGTQSGQGSIPYSNQPANQPAYGQQNVTISNQAKPAQSSAALPFAELIGYRPSPHASDPKNQAAAQNLDNLQGVTSERYNGDVKLGECAVCMEELKADELLATLPCGHHFHHSCIAEWFQTKIRSNQNGYCPCCNAIIVKPQPTTQGGAALPAPTSPQPPQNQPRTQLPPLWGAPRPYDLRPEEREALRLRREAEPRYHLCGIRITRSRRWFLVGFFVCMIALIVGNLAASFLARK